MEVLSFLSVKYLMHFKCVCKSWKTIISDPTFVKLHLKISTGDDVAGNNHIEQGSTGEVLDGVSQPRSFGNCKNLKLDVHYVPDSLVMETSSSFGSTSSSPSLANLPHIRVHVEDGGSGGVRAQQQQQQQDQKVLGIDEQFAQMVVRVGGIG